MKTFLEIYEDIGETAKTPKRFRLEVKNIKEAKLKLKEAQKGFKGLKYRKRLHICRHGEDGKPNQPCSVTYL